MVLPSWVMGGFSTMRLMRPSTSPPNMDQPAWMWPTMWTWLSLPGWMVMSPEPVETKRSGCAETLRVRSNWLSDANAAVDTVKRIAVASRRSFMMCLPDKVTKTGGGLTATRFAEELICYEVC